GDQGWPRRGRDPEPAGIGERGLWNDAQVLQIGGQEKAVEPREGVQRLIDERVPFAAHLDRHGRESLPDVVGDQERAGSLRAIIAHGAPRRRSLTDLAPPVKGRAYR